jgi:hypothetical protein
MEAEHAGLGIRYLYCDGGPTLLFTENETNRRIFGSRNLHGNLLPDEERP